MDSIGKYKILGTLGQGGMGSIFKALHPTLGETVVIKKLTLQGKDMIERFRREAKIQMKIVHPSIIQVYDHFEEKGDHYIVMEYVDGITLEELIQTKKTLGNVAACLIFSQVAKALSYAHKAGVVHRDIKPANVTISKEGEVKFLDFGVASMIGQDDDGLTKAGMTIGTISYIAPESISNAKLHDQRIDIYSAGVLLYEMLTGKKPFEGGFTPEMIQRVQKGKFIKPRKLNPNIKPGIERVVLKAMHKKIKRRTANADKLVDKLASYLRRFQTDDQIQRAIKDYISGQDDLESKASSPLLRPILWGLVLLLLVAGAGGAYLGFEKGLKYEWIYPDQYGVFQVELRPKKGFKTVTETFYRLQILRQDGKRWHKVEAPSLAVQHRIEQDRKNRWVFKSDKIYLKKGVYRLVVDLEQEQFQTTFFLASLEGQKEIASSTSDLVLLFEGETKIQQLPAQINLQPVDLSTGKAIHQGLEAQIYHQHGWVDWQEFQAKAEGRESILSNKDYSFRLSGKGYYPQTVNFRIQPEQTKITLKTPMLSKPVALKLKTQLAGVHLLLDNKTSFLQAGKSPKVMPIPKLEKSLTLQLFPGRYYLSLIYDQGWGRSLSQTQEIILEPGQGLGFEVKLAEDGKSLKLIKKEER